MRGSPDPTGALFSYVSLEDRIPADHPLRALRALVNPALTALSPQFDALYAASGRPSIPPEQLLRALLLQVLYTVRSERQLIEQLDYNLLFRWFVGLSVDDAVWHPTVFTKNRDRLLAGDIAEAFLGEVLRAAQTRGLLSQEHFSVDGTLLEAWASQKSFQATRAGQSSRSSTTRGDDDAPDDPGNPTVDFHGERRTNATHTSTTDPDARLAKKGVGKEAKLCHQASVVIDNRHGLIVATVVDPPGGTVERDQAIELLTRLPDRHQAATLGADKGYATREFVATARACGVTPHVADREHPVLDGRTTRHPGYTESQRRRKLVEEGYGWGKQYGLLRKLRHRGTAVVGWIFTFTMAVYDLVRIRTLIRVGVAAP
jgi:transposase